MPSEAAELVVLLSIALWLYVESARTRWPPVEWCVSLSIDFSPRSENNNKTCMYSIVLKSYQRKVYVELKRLLKIARLIEVTSKPSA